MSFFICYTVLFFFIQHSLCDSIALQSNEQSESSLSDVEKKINAEHVIFDEEKTSKEGSSTYNRGQLGSNERKRDENRYGNQDTVRKEYDKGKHSLGESEVVDHEKNSFERHGSGYYKKGHRRTGFSNNYHKDESGNNSSFYEDSDDEGGHRSSGDSGGYYGQKSQNLFRDGSRDVSYAERDKAYRGIYGNRRNFNDHRDYVRGYSNDRYADDKKKYLRDEAKRYFNKNRGEIYYRKEKHYPIIYRNNDNVPSFGYSRYYIDTLPAGYYREDPYIIPYIQDDRHFPHWQRNYEREAYYPYRGGYDRNYQDSFYNNGYLRKYRHDFDNGYHGI